MRRKQTVFVATLLVVVFSLSGCRTTKRDHSQREKLLPGLAVLVKHPIARDKKIDNEREGNILETRRQNFILPRAWPAEEIDPARRMKAYEDLLALRARLGLQKVLPQWLDPRRQGPGGPGSGPGGGPGVPGDTGPGGCAWYSAGPTNINGRVTSIAVDATNRDRLLVATVGGLWRSTDRGRRWQRVSDDFLATVFASVAINPALPSEVFAGGGDPNYHGAGGANGLGIWRSTASGDFGTWSKVSPPEFDNQVIYRIRIDPVAPNDLYAATSAGVYLGTRSGGTINWAHLGGFDAWANDVVVDFSSTPRKVYAGVRSASATFALGIWKWNGTAWNRRDAGVPTASSRTINLALSTSSPNTLYAKVEGNTGHLQGVYKTTTGGEPPAPGVDAWSNLPAASVLDDSGFSTFWYSWYNSVIEVDPMNADIVYAGGFNLWRTTNGGGLWSNVSGGADPSWPQWIHADQHAVAFDPVNSKIVYSGNDGGIDTTTDTSVAPWRWIDISHGMVVTEFYRMTTQLASASLIAGGSQDNGTEITFGNRTWYNPGGCDGADVAVDGTNSDTLYANCNGGLYELANPVPGTSGGGSTISWTSPPGLSPSPPVVTDPSTPGAALAAADGGCGPARIFKTTDGVNWSSIATLPAGARVSLLAVAPGTAFQRYYVGLMYAPPPLTDCPGFSGMPFDPTVWRTTNGGGSWLMTSTGVPVGWLTSIAIDPANADRAFLMAGNAGAALTTDGGAVWVPVTGALPAGAFLADGALDPFDPAVLYLATNVGVLKGTVSTGGGMASATWTPFDEGLPDGLNVTDLAVNPATGILSVSSMGHASYQRDIRSGVTCPERALLVRDNVFDRGVVPSPSGVPDPEHPIPDPLRPMFYKPDDTPGGQRYWWTSTDIRIDVSTIDPPKNQLANVDHVEFESCPVEILDCPVGTLLDSRPRRGRAARGYVQVTNRGLQAITNVRVTSLWTDATTALPLLPASFWSTTFPSGAPCGALDESTGWHFIEPGSPCKTIPVINPDLPEVTGFNWSVPADAPEHACFLTIVEAEDDPLDPSIRATNERRVWVLVPQNRQISQRNLHIVDPPMGSGGAPSMVETIEVPNPTEKAGIDLIFSAVALKQGVRLILPTAAGVDFGNVRPARSYATKEEIELARRNQLDPSAVFDVPEGTTQVRLPIPPGGRWHIGLSARSDGPARLTVVASQNGTILGGSTYVLRSSKKP